MSYKKGFTLFSALLMVLLVTFVMAIIGTVFLKTTQIEQGIKTFKTTKDAAESTAYAVIDEIKSGSLSANCDPGCGNNTNSNCTIDLPTDIKEAVEKSSGIEEVTAYLLSNCTDSVTGVKIYTIKIEAKAKNGAKTYIYFIYEK
jgi:hypothetical protein